MNKEHKIKIGKANRISLRKFWDSSKGKILRKKKSELLKGKQHSKESKRKLTNTLKKIGAGKWNKGKKKDRRIQKKIK